MKINTTALWKCKELKLIKYDTEKDYRENKPSSVESHEGNLVTNNGLTTLWHIITGDTEPSTTYPKGFYAFAKRDADSEKNISALDDFYVGIGTSSQSAQVTDVALNSSTAYYAPISKQTNGNYITYSSSDTGNPSITIEAVFDATTANDVWGEWGIFNGNPSNPGSNRIAATAGDTSFVPGVDYNIVMLNHKVETMGTKASGSVWITQITIELQNAG